MFDLLTALISLKVPAILIVFGLLSISLAVIGVFQNIHLSKQKQWFFGILGSTLFILGIVFPIIAPDDAVTSSEELGENTVETQIELVTATNTLSSLNTKTETPFQSESTQGYESVEMTDEINPIDSAPMVYVPAGEFLMGTSDEEIAWIVAQDWCSVCKTDWYSKEQPQHEVYLDSYWLYQYEVTNDQFSIFLNAVGNQRESGFYWFAANEPDAKITQTEDLWIADEGFKNHPVVYVTWYGASAYCEWAGGRLPSEAEWEKAARGDEGRIFPWGSNAPSCDYAQYFDCGGETIPVGILMKGVSSFGAFDMAGNVWEFVFDGYDEFYYADSGHDNPIGDSDSASRVIRGGSWFENAWDLRSAFRSSLSPVDSGNNLGFRCVIEE